MRSHALHNSDANNVFVHLLQNICWLKRKTIPPTKQIIHFDLKMGEHRFWWCFRMANIEMRIQLYARSEFTSLNEHAYGPCGVKYNLKPNIEDKPFQIYLLLFKRINFKWQTKSWLTSSGCHVYNRTESTTVAQHKRTNERMKIKSISLHFLCWFFYVIFGISFYFILSIPTQC